LAAYRCELEVRRKKVVFCCYMAGETEKEGELGNIYESSVLEIWNGISAQTFKKSDGTVIGESCQ